MGINAAKSAVLVSTPLHLNHAPARLLLHMALEVMDSDDVVPGIPARRYFGGRTLLAAGLGIPVDARDTPAAHQAVKRALAELVEKTVLFVRRRGGFGRNAEFELLLHSDYPSDELLMPEGLEVPPGKGVPGRSLPNGSTAF